jgi:MoxR-like ATPase
MNAQTAIECRPDLMCRPYCQALGVLGVETGLPGLCEVPVAIAQIRRGEPLEIENTEVAASFEQDLRDKLFSKVEELLTVTPEKLSKVEPLTTAHNDVFNARKELWMAMVSSAKQRRSFTDTENDFYTSKINGAAERVTELKQGFEAPDIIRAQAIFDAFTLENYGLLFDDQATDVINRVVGNVMDGKPTLLVGEKGLAKTQIARFVARMVDGDDDKLTPILISGHGSMMSDELMGKTGIENGSTVFRDGKLVAAMKDGRVPILDEVNLSDQMIMMRMQDILLKRPGDKIILQENGHEAIEVQPGFAAIATANEYANREQLDTAFRDRFDVIRLNYPDNTTTHITANPVNLLRLGFAASLLPNGELSKHAEHSDIEKLAKIAHATQRLYTLPAREITSTMGDDKLVVGDVLDDAEPLMTDCITPRTVYDIVKRASGGNKPGQTIGAHLERAIISLDQGTSNHNQGYAKQLLKLIEKK